MTTEIILPTKVAKSIVPPPKKSEIIEALAARRVALLYAEYEKWQATQDRLQAEIDAEILAYFLANQSSLKPEINSGSVWDCTKQTKQVGASSIKFEMDNVPQRTKNKMVQKAMLRKERPHREELSEAKRYIRETMAKTQGDRVKAMLADPAAVRGLDAMLKRMESPQAIEEQAVAV